MKPTDFFRSARATAEPAISITAAAVALSIVCVALRMRMVYYDIETLADVRWIAKAGLVNSYFDMAVIWGTTASLLLLLLAARPRRVANGLAWFFCGFAILCILLACINIVAVSLIGGSLTFQWIYYADLFRSFTSQSAIRAALTAPFFVMVGLSLACWLALYWMSRGTLRFFNGRGLLLPVLLLGFLAVAGYFLRSYERLDLSDSNRTYVINPILELVTTAMAAPAAGLLRSEDAIEPPQLPPPNTNSNLLPPGLENGSIRNVVLIVMESVGAHYVAGTGATEAAKWTPRIASYAASTLAFRNIYAHVAHSTKSLFSLLTSRHPLFAYEGETSRFRTTALQTLSSRLKDAGLRTGFFMSGDFEFQAVDTFLDNRGFDVRLDLRHIPCSVPKYIGSTNEWPNLDAVDDNCTAEAVIRWINGEVGQPFFGIFWTGNTHWPYPSPQPPAPGAFASDPHLNRYLNALRSSDAAIGNVLDHLKERGLLDTTLVVVIGDHGEAFEEHGFRVHSNTIFQEETHIPLLLINPLIKTPGPNDTLGGMIDIAPTILHILGVPPEMTWEGRSLFDPNRPDRVFLFAPNQDMVAGYREGDYKYVYQIARNKAFVFDLANDPGEKHNKADEQSAAIIRRHLAGWLKRQERNFELLENP